MQITPDGFVAGPNGELDWMVETWDDELKGDVDQIAEPVEYILQGWILAQGFINHWVSAADE